MASFLSIIAAPAVQQTAEKGLLGRRYVRMGKVFNMIGNWVYQQGGALGYSLKDKPKLLGKLIGIKPDHASETIDSLRETVALQLSEVKDEERTFFYLYTLRELRRLGIDITALPPNKALNDKWSEAQASDVMRIAFWEGAALGYHFPDTFKDYWENTYRMRPDAEWEDFRKRGIALHEQEPRKLDEAIAELAEMAIAWATKESPDLLESGELEILKKLAKETAIENTVDNDERINALIDHIIVSSLLATKPINDEWANLTGENPMSWLSNWIVRSELLFFFLHMVDRYAFGIGGTKSRDYLVDRIVPESINRLVKSSFDGSDVKEGFDVKGWEIRMTNEAMDYFNDSTIEYGSCTKLGAEDKNARMSEDTILAKIGALINKAAFDNHIIDEAVNSSLRLVVWEAAIAGLAKSGLKKQVEETCKYIQLE